MKISILDQTPITEGESCKQAIDHTLELAKQADKLGYYRFWVSEHHNTSSFASPVPEIMIPSLASVTSRIRVGSGGVMIGHYSPFKVAEQFNMLENLFPQRIDLGLGRASGADQATIQALESGIFHRDPFDKMLELISLIEKSMISSRGNNIKAMPSIESKPEFWILGTSPDSARFAAKHGLPYSFAAFINDTHCTKALQIYHQHFTPSRYLDTPYVNLAVVALCADSEEKAKDLAKSAELWVVRTFLRGNRGPFPKNQEAQNTVFQPQELMFLQHRRTSTCIGSPQQVKTKLEELTKKLCLNELTIVTITAEFEDRLKSYRLLSEIYDLQKN